MAEIASTVVAGYDGSAASRAAVDWALEHLDPGSRLFVVTAFDGPPPWAGGPVAQDLLDEHAGVARALSTELAAELEGIDASIVTEVIGDDPARAIASVATVRDADLVVVGSHGRGRIGASVVGSVVQELLRTLDTPLLVVGERCAERLAERAELARA